MSDKHYRQSTSVIFHICCISAELQKMTLLPVNKDTVFDTSCLACYRWHCKVTLWKQHRTALQYILTSPKPHSVHLIMISGCRGYIGFCSLCFQLLSVTACFSSVTLWQRTRTGEILAHKRFRASLRSVCHCCPHCFDKKSFALERRLSISSLQHC